MRNALLDSLKGKVEGVGKQWAVIQDEVVKEDDKIREEEEARKKAEEEKYANAREVSVVDGVTKYVFTEGAEDASIPQNGDEVTAHYTGRLASNGEKFDSSVDRGDPFKFTLGQGQVISCWDKGFATMKKGEKAELKCNAANAYGERGSPPKIPGGATLKFEVELISFKSKDGKSEL